MQEARVQSVMRALSILDVFLKEKKPLSIAELHRLLDLPKPTVFRLVRELEAFDFLKRMNNDANKYWIGSKILQLSFMYNEQFELYVWAMPYLRRIRDETKETVHLNVMEKNERVCVYCLQGTEEIRYIVNVGHRSPLHVGPSAKIMLASMDDDFINQYIADHKPLETLSGPLDPECLWAQINKIREQGYCVTMGERNKDGLGIAAPVRDASGKVIASISLTLPVMRKDHVPLERYIEMVVKESLELSAQLGYVRRQA